jgi:hypothetical protein
MAGSCEHGNEFFSSIKGGEFISQLKTFNNFSKTTLPRGSGLICTVVNLRWGPDLWYNLNLRW